MADDTAAEAPLYYIADEDLWLNGPGGNVRAFAAGDHVPPGHVDRFGWAGLVSAPGADSPGAQVSSAPSGIGPGDPGTAPATATAATTSTAGSGGRTAGTPQDGDTA
jgi:hypothetical protein